ncbi:hypothetical protein E2C01_021011 [Portunus trituberculatus]|uniref:Uncharacterized protein n=1 Tax=Portunus trituberculatus TaxID=210409 RepID=A0A5B7E3U3_PORTR|nr:hypothetical protein [Portunus trituberculatus]
MWGGGLIVLSQQGRVVPTYTQNVGTWTSVAIQVEERSQCIHGGSPVLHKPAEFGEQMAWEAYQAQLLS